MTHTTTHEKAPGACDTEGLQTDTTGPDFPTTDAERKHLDGIGADRTQERGRVMNTSHPMATPAEKREALEVIRLAHPGISSTVQCERIRAALAQFSITTYEITRYLDCYDATARVCQLRKQGAAVVTHWRTIVTDSGEKHRVGLYVMAGVNRE